MRVHGRKFLSTSLFNDNYRYTTTNRVKFITLSHLTIKRRGIPRIEIQSMKIAIDEAGTTAVHPERMEALADMLVEKLKQDDSD